MKICICCSLSFTNEVLTLAKKLEKQGFELLLPNSVIERSIEKPDFDPVQSKIRTGNVNKHIDKVKASDAVLVCNYTKNGTENYIGANTFLEIAAAHYFGKPIYALNSLPDQPYINDEIRSFDIKVLNGDLGKIQKEEEQCQ